MFEDFFNIKKVLLLFGDLQDISSGSDDSFEDFKNNFFYIERSLNLTTFVAPRLVAKNSQTHRQETKNVHGCLKHKIWDFEIGDNFSSSLI